MEGQDASAHCRHQQLQTLARDQQIPKIAAAKGGRLCRRQRRTGEEGERSEEDAL